MFANFVKKKKVQHTMAYVYVMYTCVLSSALIDNFTLIYCERSTLSCVCGVFCVCVCDWCVHLHVYACACGCVGRILYMRILTRKLMACIFRQDA